MHHIVNHEKICLHLLDWPSLWQSGIFLEILGRGPRAFPIGKISDVNPEFGKFSEYSKLIILPC